MKKSTWATTIRTILIAFVIGGASGVLATALTTDYLREYAFEIGQITEPLQQLTEEVRPRSFPKTLEEAKDRVREQALPAVVEAYPASVGSAPRAYHSQDMLARGILLSSDGWMLFPEDVQMASSEIVVGREVYDVSDIVADDVLGMQFVKVDATNLPVLAFSSGLDLRAGDQVFLLPSRDAFSVAEVEEVWHENAVLLDSDIPHRRYLVDQSLDELEGAAVTDASGELIGIVDTASGAPRILPFEAVLPSLRALLREQEPVRPSLGVQAIDLSRAIGLSQDLTRQRRAGALLYGSASVKPASAAKEAGLLPGDIILSLNDQPINDRRFLDEYLFQTEPEQTVALRIDRDGKEQEVQVVLKALP